MKLLTVALLFVTFLSAEIPQILPTPRSVTEKKSPWKITSAVKIVLGNDGKADMFAAEKINDRFIELKGSPLKVVAASSVRKLTGNYIFIGKPTTEYGKKFLKERNGTLTPEMKTEGYFLDVDDNGIVIIAESDKGLFYGVMTLVQMMRQEKRSVIVPGVTIRDYPLQPIRGITDDISRGQVSTMENFKRIISFIARYKMNVFMPYMEDMFVFTKHPEIGKNRGALTAAECRELDEYAKRHFVELIPIFQTLGHWENILIHPEYVRYAEFPGAHTLNVSDEKMYALLDEMIGEVSAAFSSPYFHIAADESWDVGLGVNRQRVAASDLATVHAEHYKRVFALVKKYGKKPMMYGDIILNHPDILKKIPPEVTIVDWAYGARFDFPGPEVFQSAGFPYVISPAVWNFTGPYPNYLNTFVNIQQFNLDGYVNGSRGIVCSNWNDFGGEALRELNFYGYAWSAECAWNPLTADQTSFHDKFLADFYSVEETDKLRTVYTLLNDPANQFHWYEVWRHPLLPNRDDMIWEKRLPLIQRMQSIHSTMPFVLSLIDDLTPSVGTNKTHLAHLAFVAKFNLWFAKKIEAQEKIRLLTKDSIRSKQENAAAIAALCRPVIEELISVKGEFEKVWMLANRREGLSLLLDRYDRQISYWREIADQAERGRTAFEPSISSQWIYHPKGNAGAKDTVLVRKAFFRTSVKVNAPVANAKVQLLGDTWTRLFVNGTFVGEVAARRSLSLIVENQRAKIFDITALLNDSVNVIAVEAQNFQENGSAGMNLYGEMTTKEGAVIPLLSDGSWSVADTVSVDWQRSQTASDRWVPAFAKKYPVPVVAPNLSAGRTSWFER